MPVAESSYASPKVVCCMRAAKLKIDGPNKQQDKISGACGAEAFLREICSD